MQTLIAICVCLILAFGVQTFRVGARDEQIALMKADAAEAVAKQERENREREQQMADSARKASDVYQANVNRVRASADGARTELERLRDAIASAGPAATASAASGPANGTGGPERELLGACAATLQGMAAQADRLEAKVIGLQDFIRSITR